MFKFNNKKFTLACCFVLIVGACSFTSYKISYNLENKKTIEEKVKKENTEKDLELVRKNFSSNQKDYMDLKIINSGLEKKLKILESDNFLLKQDNDKLKKNVQDQNIQQEELEQKITTNSRKNNKSTIINSAKTCVAANLSSDGFFSCTENDNYINCSILGDISSSLRTATCYSGSLSTLCTISKLASTIRISCD